MKPKYFLVGFVAVAVIIGWNVFLAQRDQKLFDAYDTVERLQQGPQSTLTPKEVYCSQLPQPHPDCTVE
jgi:hypothetical protein